MSNILIHIGYHKTGTSWLQEYIFNKSDLGFISPWNRGEIFKDWVSSNPLYFSHDEMKKKYISQINGKKKCIRVLSNERLSGYPASAGYDSKLIADKLSSVFKEPKILIVIREQKSMIRSMYPQYINDGGCLTITNFLFPPDSYLERAPIFKFEFYEYDRLINYYQKIFSANNVLVLPHELMRNDIKNFMQKLCNFLDIEEIFNFNSGKINVGLKLPGISVMRYGNMFFCRNQLNPNSLFNSRKVNEGVKMIGRMFDKVIPVYLHQLMNKNLFNYISKSVLDRYIESNKRTSDLIGINLGQYGYID